MPFIRWTGWWLYAGKWVNSNKFEIWKRDWGWGHYFRRPGQAGCWPSPVPQGPWILDWLCSAFLGAPLETTGNVSAPRMGHPKRTTWLPSRIFPFSGLCNWATIMVLAGWFGVTQIVYRDRDWHKNIWPDPKCPRGVSDCRHKFGNSLLLKVMKLDEIIWEWAKIEKELTLKVLGGRGVDISKFLPLYVVYFW